MHRCLRTAALIVAVVLLGSCGGGGGGVDTSGPATTPTTPVVADITLLFFGNSHTLNNELPSLVSALVQAAHPGRTVAQVVAPGSMFLDERLEHGPSIELMQRQRWSAVVLQAQRYSTSGTVTYSTHGSEEWVRRARRAGAMPVLFPEWPRRGIDETARIFELHRSIAAAVPACLPPIPQAFDIALARYPSLALHAADGNHSSPAGALLAALVIASTITGRSASEAPTLATAGVDATTQGLLRTAAREAIERWPPRASCPEPPI